tara:strand:+ start:646 stop:798 length:153 start_codon:yes stop_codon:yes gene_type:complete
MKLDIKELKTLVRGEYESRMIHERVNETLTKKQKKRKNDLEGELEDLEHQ